MFFFILVLVFFAEIELNEFFFRHYSRLKWKSCSFQDTCFYAHSKIEKEIWLLESKFHVDRKDLVKEFQLPRPQNREQIYTL